MRYYVGTPKTKPVFEAYFSQNINKISTHRTIAEGEVEDLVTRPIFD